MQEHPNLVTLGDKHAKYFLLNGISISSNDQIILMLTEYLLQAFISSSAAGECHLHPGQHRHLTPFSWTFTVFLFLVSCCIYCFSSIVMLSKVF